MIFLDLFLAFLLIGLVAFGGGYAVLPLLERMIVLDRGWIAMERFVDMIAISQMTPGPIAINGATFIGYQLISREWGVALGILGAATSTIGVVFGPALLIFVVSRFYTRFKDSPVVKAVFRVLRPALVGLIMASVASVASSAVFDVPGVLIVLLALLALWRLKWHPLLVIGACALLGLVVYM